MSSTEKEASRIEALSTAEAIIAGTIGIIEGSRLLSYLADDLVSDWREDADFVVFGAVSSETDHLPIGDVRRHWSPEALKREDREIERAEATCRDAVTAASHNLIVRFRDIYF